MKVRALLADAIAQIKIDEAGLEAQLLLQHLLNVNRAWLIAHENDTVEPNIHAAFEALLKRRINGEPIAYILGYREFYGLSLKVTPDTLIPRPDTETLVDAALAKIPQSGNASTSSFPRRRESSSTGTLAEKTLDSDFLWNDKFNVLDLGTGTGAIALALAKHRPHAHATATDVSQAALDVAIENAKNLDIPNVTFVLSDWFLALKNEKFDVIVSNPPYIEESDAHLKQGDLRFEPISALTSGQDGLDAIRKIIQQSAQHLNPQGWLLLEHGYDQAAAVANLLKMAEFNDITHVKDLAGIERVTLGRR